MKRRRFFWLVYPPYLLVIFLSLGGLLLYAWDYLGDFYYRQTEQDLEIRARLSGSRIAEAFRRSPDGEGVNDLCRTLGRTSATRITVILSDGKVVGDSEKDPAAMDNHAGRPEVRKALRGEMGVSVRYSATLGMKLMYVAIPLEGGAPGVVRVSLPVTALEEIPRTFGVRLATVGIGVLLLAGLLSFIITRRVVLPLEELKKGAEKFAAGDLETRLPVSEWEEIGSLGEEMNRMATHLDDRIRTVISQRNEIEAVLSSMVEGVVAFDVDERILSVNRAASDLFGIDGEKVRGVRLMEAVRNPALQDMVSEILAVGETVEGEIVIRGGKDRQLQVHGSLLTDSSGEKIGALTVFNDVTRIRELEGIRRDFVANASHEIRTPVTSIKGFVETLMDGAIDDRETAERFLKIIGRHADRLNAIVEDLLSLSRLEDEYNRGEIPLAPAAVRAPVLEAADLCELEAGKRGVKIQVTCGEEVSASVNESLLVQAVANLIDNAVKYSSEGRVVEVSCLEEGEEVLIRVRDQGCGIAREHLPRLFERFYRADKARSRELGGTGLGLAIVKHIVQLHGGQVRVESKLDEGSTFTIVLPCL